jgi:hypothetical protein
VDAIAQCFHHHPHNLQLVQLHYEAVKKWKWALFWGLVDSLPAKLVTCQIKSITATPQINPHADVMGGPQPSGLSVLLVVCASREHGEGAVRLRFGGHEQYEFACHNDNGNTTNKPGG